MPARLVLLGGPQPLSYPLAAFNTIGRHPDSSIRLNEGSISKEHCRIMLRPDGRYLLRDLGSRNGTFVGGKQVVEHVLVHGDLVKVANVELRFEERQDEDLPTRLVKVLTKHDHTDEHVQQRMASGKHFLPAAEVGDLATLKADYERLRVAHQLSQTFSIKASLDDLLQEIVDETFRLIHTDRAVILLYDPQGDRLVPSYVRQKNNEEIRLSPSVLEEVKNEKRALLVTDGLASGRGTLISQRIRSLMCVPLIHHDELLGAMHVESTTQAGMFTEKDLVAFSGIATQAAVAIKNHQLVKKIEGDAGVRAQLQRLLSPNLVEQVVSGKLKLDRSGSLREVTMLFADIRGFTAMSERSAPETVVALLNDYFEMMVGVLFRHGGTLDKYVGDELIGLFGAPVDVPDAPLSAVRCALDMKRALEEFNRMRTERGLDAIEIGIGINTGKVVAGAIGASRTVQYTVIGDAVNVASRLCSEAKSGEVILSHSTLERCLGHVVAERREPVRVKGKSEPLRIWAATAISENAPPSAGGAPTTLGD